MSDYVKDLKKTIAYLEAEGMKQNSKKLYAEQIAEYLKIIQKPKKVSKAKKAAAQALTVNSIAKAFGIPPEFLVGTHQAPLIDAVTSTAYATPVMLPKGTPSGSAGTTDFGGWGVSSTNSPVSEWKKYAALALKQELLMDPTVIALQTRVKELEQKLAKKELQESDLKEPKKRKRIVEI